MSTVVLDTNILIDYVHGYSPWVKIILKERPQLTQLVLPTIVIAEYFASNVFDYAKEEKVADETFSLFSKQDLTLEIAKELGKILRHKTYVPGAGTADLIIAATALSLNAPLATNNKNHFASIPHLHFFDPSTINN